jgi:hypothetical protein
MSKLLLFSLLVFCTAAFALASNSGVTPSQNESVATPANPFAGMPQGLNASGESQRDASEQSRMCLRIHAFIFKTNDDGVPKLVRETTCMPARRAEAKKVNQSTEPKLVPATGGNSF